MSDVQKLVHAFTDEWTKWGQSKWNLKTDKKQLGHVDDDPTFAKYVINTYCSIVGDNPSISDISDDEYFWSAVGISYGFKAAGFTKAQFPFSNAHSIWIRKFVKARKEGKAALYHGYRLAEALATPEVGDLVGYTYDSAVDFDGAQKFFDRTTPFKSHTDLVVARRNGEIDVIGFNVEDSVTMKTIAITKEGLVADRTKKWFVVLKRMDF